MNNESISSKTGTTRHPSRWVVCHRYGQTFRRRTPLSYQDAKSDPQLLQRGRMNAVVAFYKNLVGTPFQQIWRIAAQKGGCSGYNLFVMYNINAFDKDGYIFDYSNIDLSEGKLQLPAEMKVAATGENAIAVTWEEVPGQTPARANDRLMAAVIYEHAPFEVFICPTDASRRGEQRALISLDRQGNETVHLYVFFRTEGSDQFSEQRYFKLEAVNPSIP
ncbi:MAG: DUF6266 family protein [Odoribacter sp.]